MKTSRRNYGESLEAYGMRSRREQRNREQFKKMNKEREDNVSEEKKNKNE